jgi:urease subunit gamma
VLLSPQEQERLLTHLAAGLARERRERGLRLNYPEAVALISSFVLEGARDGRSVADLIEAGQRVLTAEDVLDAYRRWSAQCRWRRPSRTVPSWSRAAPAGAHEEHARRG